MRRAALALCLVWRVSGVAAQATKPHIIIAVVDDLGWSDVGFQGSRDLRGATPHMDALAAQGVRFSAMYACSECTPSRAMLLTGRHAIELGLQDSVIHGTEPRGLDLTRATLADALRDRGYRTCAVGKWHLGFYSEAYLPRRRGFDFFFGVLTGGGDHYAKTTTETYEMRGNSTRTRALTGRNLWHDDAPAGDEFYAMGESLDHTTTLYTQRAVRHVEEQAALSTRLFLYLAFQAVHGPVQADAASHAAETTCGTVSKNAADARARLERLAESESSSSSSGAALLSSSDADAYAADDSVSWPSRSKLCGMVSMVDTSIGAVRAELELQAMWADSLLWLLSDNGDARRF